MWQIHVGLIARCMCFACTCVWVYVCTYGSGLCRCCTALTCTPPWNAKYRPVKAIPARRLNRPTNPLVDTQPPLAELLPDFLYFPSPSRLFPLLVLHAGMEETQTPGDTRTQSVSKYQILCSRCRFRYRHSPLDITYESRLKVG